MFDAFMAWDVNYAIEMGKGLEGMNPAWLEEPLPPEQIGGFKRLRDAVRIPIATGEHVHGRWQSKELLALCAVDVLQNDPDWTGGISEQVKICNLASAFSTPVIAHGHSLLPALHVAAAQSPTTVPYVEYLIRHQESKQFFQKEVYRPENGMVRLPTGNGLGMTLDEEKIKTKHFLHD
jgi:D-galactarolactone cycloisomerase